MAWRFWGKKQAESEKLSKPKELPSRVGKHLVVNLKYDPDWVWALKMVDLKSKDRPDVFEFRVFDPVSTLAQSLDIRDYHSLDSHQENIYFEGFYNKSTWEMEVIDHLGFLTAKKPA